jgi:hypothetical protein
MSQGYIEYNGRMWNKTQLQKELNVSNTLWIKIERIVYNRLKRQGVSIDTLSDQDFYSLVIEEAIRKRKDIDNEKKLRDDYVNFKINPLEKPINIGGRLFNTFEELEKCIGYKEFNYKNYLEYVKQCKRQSQHSLEDYIAYLYKEDTRFALKMIYVAGMIPENVFMMACKCYNQYLSVQPERWQKRHPDESTRRLTALEAIQIAYGKLNVDNSVCSITNILCDRTRYNN